VRCGAYVPSLAFVLLLTDLNEVMDGEETNGSRSVSYSEVLMGDQEWNDDMRYGCDE